MSSTRIRKYESGAEKRKKKQRLEAAAQKQKGALDRFVIRETETPEETNVGEGHGDDAIEAETPSVEIPEANVEEGNGTTDASTADGDEGNEDNIGDGINNSFQPNIFDPRTWDALDPKMIDILLEKGPKRDMSIEHGPRDKLNRRFSTLSYTRVMSNREKCDREWLVYSKDLTRYFVFVANY
ncbi:unnamed protein product [Urochloa humidicola]